MFQWQVLPKQSLETSDLAMSRKGWKRRLGRQRRRADSAWGIEEDGKGPHLF